MLPTPPRGDAVSVRYRPENVYLKRTRTSLFLFTHRRTLFSLRDPVCKQTGPPRKPPLLATLNLMRGGGEDAGPIGIKFRVRSKVTGEGWPRLLANGVAQRKEGASVSE